MSRTSRNRSGSGTRSPFKIFNNCASLNPPKYSGKMWAISGQHLPTNSFMRACLSLCIFSLFAHCCQRTFQSSSEALGFSRRYTLPSASSSDAQSLPSLPTVSSQKTISSMDCRGSPITILSPGTAEPLRDTTSLGYQTGPSSNRWISWGRRGFCNATRLCALRRSSTPCTPSFARLSCMAASCASSRVPRQSQCFRPSLILATSSADMRADRNNVSSGTWCKSWMLRMRQCTFNGSSNFDSSSSARNFWTIPYATPPLLGLVSESLPGEPKGVDFVFMLFSACIMLRAAAALTSSFELPPPVDPASPVL
mmetsp:Transcript_94399/g.158478  ORF Transcript_94399/g.158478 Transcript_94399/m.158478 type:complete len:310 (-) Transcript_94399:149-1078(-)